jgi:hypothetical protein
VLKPAPDSFVTVPRFVNPQTKPFREEQDPSFVTVPKLSNVPLLVLKWPALRVLERVP